jgi:hypothetical protein
MLIKNIGGKVETVWEGMRPLTRKMVAGAVQTVSSAGTIPSSLKASYDAHADWEVSDLLTALDERSHSGDIRKDSAKLIEIEQMAKACVRLLETQSASAEVFIQLAERAIKANDYDHLDKLADRLNERFSVSEIAEIIRQTDMPQIRAIAYETLAMMPISAITPLLDDSLYAGIGANSLEQKAYEFDSEEARDILDQFDAENETASE